MKTNSINGFSVKGILTKVVVAGALAAALFVASPQKAEAQGFRIGVQIGQPTYYAPVQSYGYAPVQSYGYGYREDFYARQRRLEFERREAFARQQAWERSHRFGERGYYDRDRRFDHR